MNKEGKEFLRYLVYKEIYNLDILNFDYKKHKIPKDMVIMQSAFTLGVLYTASFFLNDKDFIRTQDNIVRSILKDYTKIDFREFIF